ncbi:RHS repeat-associated core domain-containing protein [Lentzea sp. CA-135723]|uniref:RHS repeat-associated core domain-containing protein n=1 Tax=Lentzea sp. CA-135723 TaxID=3239950 RepID=UPI003D912264
MRRLLARTLVVALTATVVTASFAGTALAAGPSVPLPGTPPTPVSEQKMGSRAADQATTSALQGNQPAGTAPDGGGTPTASPLAQSASWDVSAHTGDFTWSYPLRVPPAPGGLTPDLALGYSSSAVDGRTSATNNQASWIGDGWDLFAGFIERRYVPCADDKTGGTTPPKDVGDLCWRSDNGFASYPGGGGELVRDDATGTWREKSDNGNRVERLTGTGNGDDNGESWRITTLDGTQYLFGSRADAKSAWTVPVFGDDAGEPCHGATFAASSCAQAWRWNLDKVIDRHGNVILYNYAPETNSYGANNKDAAVPYTRGGTLLNVQYGLRDDVTQATGLVEFTTADRCVPGSDCAPDKKDNWPDVPWDGKCDTATCKDKHSPSFWTTKRLDKITTKVFSGGKWNDVERWTLEHAFPAPGDGEKAALWLKGVTHTGLAGTAVSLPQVTFEGTKMPNRVNKLDGVGPLIRYRVTGVVSESGGVTTIKYADPECVDGTRMPANPETNTLRCYPAKWQKKDFAERTDYFHKYVVEEITQSDRISSSTEQVSRYSYLGGAAWAWDDSEFTKDDRRDWNEFRGFGHVEIRQGRPNDPAGPVTMTDKRFYRGMNDDKQPGGKRDVKLTDSAGLVRTDDEWLRGTEYESQVRDGESDRIVSKAITVMSVQGPTAKRGAVEARMIRPATETSYTTLPIGSRVARVETAYDDRGLPVTSSDLGDLAVTTDDRCTRTTYARNDDRWLQDVVARVETVAVACTATPRFPQDALSDTRSAFDGQDFGKPPLTGTVTRTEVAKDRPASGPVYAPASTAVYDRYGRVTSAADALGRASTTTYTPADGAVTGVEVANALGQKTKTTLEPFYGQPSVVVDANDRRTETTYDALGRKAEVWLPNRIRTGDAPGNARFSYDYRKDAPTVVTTTAIGPNGRFTGFTEVYDGLLRLRQKQAPAPGGGRLIADTRYDSQGRAYKQTMPYFTDSAVDDRLWVANDVDVAQQNVSTYDGVGRETASITYGGAFEKWRTSYRYEGDRTHVVPPSGGTPTTEIVDVRGQRTELRQYRGEVAKSEYDSTKYTYTAAGQRATITSPGGTVWRDSYDLRGRKVKEENPDRGTTLLGYDDANQLVSTTDARGVVLTHTYDELGRKRRTSQGDALLSELTYDTASYGKGLPATATRYSGGAAYTSKVLGYNGLNKPLGTTVTIPQSEGALAGSYTSYARYNMDGSASGTTYAAIGSLPVEAVQHGYDDLGKPTTTTGGFGGTTDELVSATTYTRYGELARTQLGTEGKRVWLSRYYDTNTRRLNRTIVDAELPNPKQSDVNLAYDDAGNLTSVVDGADKQCFRMDHVQRLTEAWTAATDCAAGPALGGPAPYSLSYTYDEDGNRLTETRHNPGGDTVQTGTFTPSDHRIASVQTKTPSGTRSDAFGYDAAGNTTLRGAQKLDWDAEGHLAKVTEGDKTTEFTYDADGSRLLKRDATSVTLYLGPQQLKLVTASGRLEPTRYYEHGGQMVAMRDQSGLTWLASDHQNTAQIAISADLTATQRRQLPFGGRRGTAVTFPGDKGFAGGTNDASTGLVQLGARAYDPVLGRFLSVDPVLDPGDPQQMHGYTYANNSPVTKSDPTGMFWGEIGGWFADTYRKGGEFLDKYKGEIGLVIGIASLFTPVGWVATGLALAGGVLGYLDMVDSMRKHDTTQVFLGVVGLATAGVGNELGKVAEATADGVRRVTVEQVKLGNDLTGVYSSGVSVALNQEERLAAVVKALAPEPPPVVKLDPRAAAGLPCWNGPGRDLAADYCVQSSVFSSVKFAFCQTNPEVCRWQKTHKPPGLGSRSDDFKNTQRGGPRGTGHKGSSGGQRAPYNPKCRCNQPSTPSGDAYMTDDQMWHRSDGRGRAWF